jgi:hypothetical protein
MLCFWVLAPTSPHGARTQKNIIIIIIIIIVLTAVKTSNLSLDGLVM